MIKINGEACDAAGMTITAYLATKDYNLKRIVIERNGEIVPKEHYDDTIIQDGDTIEIVSFVGGG